MVNWIARSPDIFNLLPTLGTDYCWKSPENFKMKESKICNKGAYCVSQKRCPTPVQNMAQSLMKRLQKLHEKALRCVRRVVGRRWGLLGAERHALRPFPVMSRV